MKELFYQIDYFEGEDPRDVVCINVRRMTADELVNDLEAVFKAGYGDNFEGNRYEWVEEKLDEYVVAKYGGRWSFVPMDGTFYVD